MFRSKMRSAHAKIIDFLIYRSGQHGWVSVGDIAHGTGVNHQLVCDTLKKLSSFGYIRMSYWGVRLNNPLKD